MFKTVALPSLLTMNIQLASSEAVPPNIAISTGDLINSGDKTLAS